MTREYKKREKITAATFDFTMQKLQYQIEYQGKGKAPDKRFDKSTQGLCLFIQPNGSKTFYAVKSMEMFNKKKITIPLVKRYCQANKLASSIFLTTSGPKDQIIPAIITRGIANFTFFISIILWYLMWNKVYYNQNREDKYLVPLSLKLEELVVDDFVLADSLLELYIEGYDFSLLSEYYSKNYNLDSFGLVGPVEKGFKKGKLKSFFNPDIKEGFVGNIIDNEEITIKNRKGFS